MALKNINPNCNRGRVTLQICGVRKPYEFGIGVTKKEEGFLGADMEQCDGEKKHLTSRTPQYWLSLKR